MTGGFTRALKLTPQFAMLLLRDRQIVFWNFGFFLLLLVLFLGILSGGEAAVRVALTAAIIPIGVMANALFSVGVGLSGARDRGVFRHYALTPVPQSVVVLASVTARALIVLAAAAIEVVVANVLFGVGWPGGVAAWLSTLALGTAAFCAIGFAIAAFAPAPHLANAAVDLVLLPMMALSGMSLPVAMMPSEWASIHWVLPAATMVDGLTATLVQGAGFMNLLPRLAYLGLWTGAAAALGAYGWSRRDP